MESFFACQSEAFPWLARKSKRGGQQPGDSKTAAANARAVKCDEEFLDAFG
jgi:hypothetical protein